MIFQKLSMSERLKGIVLLGLSFFFLSGCEQSSVERTGATPPSLISTEDVYEVIAPPPPLDSKYQVYIPKQVIISGSSVTPATSGDGFIFRFSWDFSAASMASQRSYLADWSVRGAEEGASDEREVSDKFFFQKDKREFVTFNKLEAGKVYVFKVVVHVTSETENRDLFLSEVVLKKIRVDLQSL